MLIEDEKRWVNFVRFIGIMFLVWILSLPVAYILAEELPKSSFQQFCYEWAAAKSGPGAGSHRFSGIKNSPDIIGDLLKKEK